MSETPRTKVTILTSSYRVKGSIELLPGARVTDFMNEDLSAFFFDIRKDSLYCDAADDPKRLELEIRTALGNDDANGTPDSYLRFAVPADGEYFLEVRDHLRRGGARLAALAGRVMARGRVPPYQRVCASRC